jgi:hypothetical protein
VDVDADQPHHIAGIILEQQEQAQLVQLDLRVALDRKESRARLD